MEKLKRFTVVYKWFESIDFFFGNDIIQFPCVLLSAISFSKYSNEMTWMTSNMKWKICTNFELTVVTVGKNVVGFHISYMTLVKVSHSM